MIPLAQLLVGITGAFVGVIGWLFVGIVTFSSYRNGKLLKRVDFYAPFFDPPPWRSAWVEKIG